VRVALTPADAEALLRPLDDEQRAVAEAVRGPVCVVAGAGTGKTRAITHRIAHAVAVGATDEDQVLAVTFTARAAGEMRERLRALGVARVTARTFHAAALRQLQHFWPSVVGGPAPSLLEHKAAVVGEAAARLGLRVDRAAVRDLSSELEWAKVGLLTPATYPAAALAAGRGEVAGQEAAVVARLIEAYEDAKTARGVIDFEDVLLLTAAMLREREDVARQVRSRYRWFTVDEYQDVSAAQQVLLDAWVGERDDVCVVGDPNQTIYTFAGADSSLLGGFAARHPGTTVVHLVRSYRSRPPVVELGNAVLASAPGAATPRLRAVRPPASVATGGAPALDLGAPTFTEHEDDVAEAEACAKRVVDLLARGVRAADVAVLVRTNGQLEVLEQALGDRSCAVPGARGGPLLRPAGGPAGRGAAAGRGQGRPRRRGGRGRPGRSGDGGRVLRRGPVRSTAPGLAEVVADVLSTAGWSPEPPSGRGQVRDRWESLAALVDHARRLGAQDPDADLPRLVADLEQRAAQQHAPVLDGVTLATMHAAKGLEWDVVLLPGLTDGTCRSPWPPRRRRSRRNAGCCTSASPAPARWSTCRGRGRARRARAAAGVPRASWTASAPACPGPGRRGPGPAPDRRARGPRSVGRPCARPCAGAAGCR
jgi:DNA helicase-2/ATP-dependent DNA helicase PcrA